MRPTPSESSVELRVAASFGQLAFLGALAETVALHADFTLDQVSDIRLAVEGVASTLVPEAVERASLRCECAVDGRRIVVRLSTVVTRTEIDGDDHSYSRRAVRRFVDSLEIDEKPWDESASGYPVAVVFSLGRASTHGCGAVFGMRNHIPRHSLRKRVRGDDEAWRLFR